MDEEEDVFVDFGLDGDVDGVPQPASSSQRQRPTASGQQQRRSHTENVRRREETWRTVDQHDIAVSVACAEELARYREEDVQLLVSATQQRVDACASCPPHPCPGGTVQRTGERLVILRTLLGSGVLRVPQFSCSSCGELELSPAAVGCQRSSPNPACWFDHWLCSAAQHFTTSGGLAMATFCTCVDAMAAAAEQLSAEPCASPSLSERQLAAAVRHRTYVQRNYLDPARHGAAIFAGPLGHCPPCAGAMLARGAPEVPRAVPAEEASAAIPSPLAASSGVMLQQEGVGKQAFLFFLPPSCPKAACWVHVDLALRCHSCCPRACLNLACWKGICFCAGLRMVDDPCCGFEMPHLYCCLRAPAARRRS